MLHTLISEARDGMTTTAVAVACDRDPNAERDIEEIVAALEILLRDGLAEREATPWNKSDAAYEPGTSKESDTAREADAVGYPDTTLRPDTPPHLLYRPTRAAIRAHELSF